MECKSRPKGTGYQRVDAVLIEEMKLLVDSGAAVSWYAAALNCAGRAHGRGSFESRRRRLVSGAVAKYGQLNPKEHQTYILHSGESAVARDSLVGMIDPTEHQLVLAQLQATKRQLRAIAKKSRKAAAREARVREALNLAIAALDGALPVFADRMSEIEAQQRQDEYGTSPSSGVH